MKYKNEQLGLYDLNYGWRFQEEKEGREQTSSSHKEVYNSTKAGMGEREKSLNFDDSDWEEIQLPHDWVTRKEFTQEADYDAGYKKRGKAWYRRKFCLAREDETKQLLLSFEGMTSDSYLYLNGQLLYRNHSGYHGFCVDITDMANFGLEPNMLSIEVDASKREGWWYEGAGIYRQVWLLKKDKIHVTQNGCFVRTIQGADLSHWTLEPEIELENKNDARAEVQVQWKITGPDGGLVAENQKTCLLEAGETGFVRDAVNIDHAVLWDLGEPNLYQMQVTVGKADSENTETENQVLDQTEIHFGIRSVVFDANTGFWLNGRNMKLKGFCNHQDHPGVGVAVPYGVKEYRVKKLLELGSNAYRCAHNTDPEILEICDRMGMLVMEENRIFNSSEENLMALRNLVRVSRNHPSVILYSMFNEEPLQGTSKGRKIAQRMKDTIRRLDDTRLVTGAMNGGYLEADGAVAVLDVVGINYNPAVYDKFHELFPDKPVLGSETCSAYSVRGESVTDYEKNTVDNFDENPAQWGNNVREGWQMVAERPFVAGTFVWTGFDYRGEPTPFTWPSVASFFGTLDSCGFKKDACYLYEAFWKEEPMVHIVCNWDTSLEEKDGDNKQSSSAAERKVMIISNCEEVELYRNGELVAQKAVELFQQTYVTVPFEAGVLKACGYRGGVCVAEEEKRTASTAVAIQLSLSKKQLRNDMQDAILVNVSLVDEAGNLVIYEDKKVKFLVTGGAEVIGVGNGDPNSHEPDVSTERRTFHGRAQAVVRNTGCEEVHVVVTAESQKAEDEKQDTVLHAEVVIPVVEVRESIPKIEQVKARVLNGFGMYYRPLEEFPKLSDFATEENDMNCFEPVRFGGNNQFLLYGQYLQYGMYRMETELCGEKQLLIPQSRGKLWVYVNEVLIGSREELAGEFLVNLPEEIRGTVTITIILQNIDKEQGEAGISEAIQLLGE